jgi:hypothetical protein
MVSARVSSGCATVSRPYVILDNNRLVSRQQLESVIARHLPSPELTMA